MPLLLLCMYGERQRVTPDRSDKVDYPGGGECVVGNGTRAPNKAGGGELGKSTLPVPTKTDGVS